MENVNITNVTRIINFKIILPDDKKFDMTLQEIKPNSNIFKFNNKESMKISVYELFLIITECFDTFQDVLTIDIGYNVNKCSEWNLERYLKDFCDNHMLDFLCFN